MNETQERLSPEMDAGIAALVAGLENECRRDLLEATRAQGLVATETMVAQAGMLAGMAVRVLMRRVQVLKVRVTERDDVIAEFTKAHEEQQPSAEVSEAGRFFDGVAINEIMMGVGEAVCENGLPRIDSITGDGATSWIATVFMLPANPASPAAAPPPVAPPSRIIRA